MSDRVFIIAEAGVNHNGSLALALQLVDAAAAAGADAVKFQTFKSKNLVTAAAPKADYQSQMTGDRESQLQMLRKLELSPHDHDALIERCGERGIEFISTPFDSESLELLVKIGVKRIKIPSGELTNSPLLHQAARSGLPVILSTGMATLDEVRSALAVLAHGYLPDSGPPQPAAFAAALVRHGQVLADKVTILHCTTEYPAPFSETNLRAMDTLATAFELPVGLSDHTPGIAVAIAAAARGAAVLEKHLTLDRTAPGPDHHASLDPDEFRQLAQSVRQVELALGSPLKQPTQSELKNIAIVRKSLVANAPIRAGERFTKDNLTAKRPGGGIPPLHYWDLLDRPAGRDYLPDQQIEEP
jgi:N-acetylneuraminate synthase